MGFWSCIVYMGILGAASYPVGRLISRRGPDPDSFIFRERGWEQNGKLYEKLNIKQWQSKIPDISKVMRRWMPEKKLEFGVTAEKVRIMIRETCTAELVHNLLNIFGLRLLDIWEGTGGRIMYLVYFFLGNLPFIMVQRYNRPRLKQLHQRLKEKEDS